MPEVLVSVAVLTIAVFVLSSIFNNAAASIRVSRSYLIAQNLLIEGMEVVKSVRDSNSMIAPNNPECWLFLAPKDMESPPVCTVDVVQGGSSYLVDERDGHWLIKSSGVNQLDLEGGPDNANEHYRLYEGADHGRFIYGNTGTPTAFFREIRFTEVALDNSSAIFTVKIQWRDGARVRTLEDSFTLYNHLAN